MPALFVITVFAKKTKGSLAQAIARQKLSQMSVDALLRTAFAARLVKLYWILKMIVPPMELKEYVVELLIVLLPMPTYVMPAPKLFVGTVFAKETKGSLAQRIARQKLSQMSVDALLRTAFAARLVKLYWILEMIVPPMELKEYVVELLIALLPMPTYVMPAPK